MSCGGSFGSLGFPLPGRSGLRSGWKNGIELLIRIQLTYFFWKRREYSSPFDPFGPVEAGPGSLLAPQRPLGSGLRVADVPRKMSKLIGRIENERALGDDAPSAGVFRHSVHFTPLPMNSSRLTYVSTLVFLK